MKAKNILIIVLISLLVFGLTFSFCCCSSQEPQASSKHTEDVTPYTYTTPQPSVPAGTSTDTQTVTPAQAPAEEPADTIPKGSRDNTPVVLSPIASGTAVHNSPVVTIDVSNTSEGYLMAEYTGSNPKVKLQITGPDQVTYTYNLHGNGYEVFPLTAGDGTYHIGVYENVSGTNYSTALSTDVAVAVTNTFAPYLYPNQYVNFNADSLPVKKAEELAYDAEQDLDVVEEVYNYIIEHFDYDYDKAKNIASGYLPVIDDVYQSNMGICFGYAAVMATMLRTQNIPTRLEVGYMKEEYHAWVSVYISDIGWINGIIEFDGNSWELMDPTFASTSKTPKDFLAENNNYLTKYVY